MGVMAAFIFAAQMINFPVAGGTSGHFLGAALAALLLGPSIACLVMAVVLTTQAFVFAAQLLNFPVAGGTSGHFLGAALAAILLGPWLACLTLAVVLGVQAFVFADGGITALGANVLNMGVIGALLVGGIMHQARMLAPRLILPISALGAWLAVMAGATATALELAASGTVPLHTVLPAMLGTHAVIGIGEAVITVAAVGAVLTTRPDLVARRAVPA